MSQQLLSCLNLQGNSSACEGFAPTLLHLQLSRPAHAARCRTHAAMLLVVRSRSDQFDIGSQIAQPSAASIPHLLCCEPADPGARASAAAAAAASAQAASAASASASASASATSDASATAAATVPILCHASYTHTGYRAANGLHESILFSWSFGKPCCFCIFIQHQTHCCLRLIKSRCKAQARKQHLSSPAQ